MQPKNNNRVKNSIAIFDIDGTLRRTIDPWMLLHNHLGTGKQGAAYYKAWVNNEISYEEMTRLDAALWKGMRKSEMLKVLELNAIRKGAVNLIDWFKKRQIPCVGISTGTAFLNDITARELNLDEVISNEILFDNDVCTGEVIINVQEHTKAEVLKTVLKKYNIENGKIISFGDGFADTQMFKLSTYSIAIFPGKEEVRSSADIIIDSEPIDQVIEQLVEIKL